MFPAHRSKEGKSAGPKKSPGAKDGEVAADPSLLGKSPQHRYTPANYLLNFQPHYGQGKVRPLLVPALKAPCCRNLRDDCQGALEVVAPSETMGCDAADSALGRPCPSLCTHSLTVAPQMRDRGDETEMLCTGTQTFLPFFMLY